MSTINFHKYQGTGNDFVMIDNRNGVFSVGNSSCKNIEALVSKLCDRKFGIGADGLILIQNREDYDFEMVYYNADGSQSLCGNGSRCAVHFANYLGIIQEKTTFLAIDGAHSAFIEDGLIHLKMNDITEVKNADGLPFIDTGSPHVIKYVEDVDTYDVFNEGRKIRNSDFFEKEGTNVNFVQLHNQNKISVRTYERGVEDETLSCGTGVTAVSLAVSSKGLTSPINIKTLGGMLKVSFEKVNEQTFREIYLIGPAGMVFEGKVEI